MKVCRDGHDLCNNSNIVVVIGVSHSCLLSDLGPICNSMQSHFDLRVVRTTVYLKAIWKKTFTDLCH